MNVSSIKKFTAALRKLPQVAANEIAAAAAPVITELALATFNAGETAYGVGWMPSAKGERVTLRDTGSLARGIRYVAIGARIRVALGVGHAKYQIGSRPVFPSAGAPLPPGYTRALADITHKVMSAHLEAA